MEVERKNKVNKMKYFENKCVIRIYFFRRISIMYFIPLEFWSNRKTTKPTYISQSGSIIAKMEMERR